MGERLPRIDLPLEGRCPAGQRGVSPTHLRPRNPAVRARPPFPSKAPHAPQIRNVRLSPYPPRLRRRRICRRRKEGAEEAGAIFVRQRLRDGRENLYGPAPQSFADDEEIRAERRFETRLAGADGEESAALLERERRFDSDLWVVEIETDEIGTLLTLVDQPKA